MNEEVDDTDGRTGEAEKIVFKCYVPYIHGIISPNPFCFLFSMDMKWSRMDWFWSILFQFLDVMIGLKGNLCGLWARLNLKYWNMILVWTVALINIFWGRIILDLVIVLLLFHDSVCNFVLCRFMVGLNNGFCSICGVVFAMMLPFWLIMLVVELKMICDGFLHVRNNSVNFVKMIVMDIGKSDWFPILVQGTFRVSFCLIEDCLDPMDSVNLGKAVKFGNFQWIPRRFYSVVELVLISAFRGICLKDCVSKPPSLFSSFLVLFTELGGSFCFCFFVHFVPEFLWEIFVSVSLFLIRTCSCV